MTMSSSTATPPIDSSNDRNSRDSQQQKALHVSHFRNEKAFPAWLRYGVPLYFLVNFAIVIASHVGTGLRVDYIVVLFNRVIERRSLIEVSIFSSIQKLWENESYPLAVLIAFTSVAWVYLERILTLYAWMTSFSNAHRREKILEFVDAFSKWSYCDLIVLIELMVAVRSSIALFGFADLEIVVVPEWGFYAFVVATMFSLLGTHGVLYLHRQIAHHEHHQRIMQEQDTEAKTLMAHAGWTSSPSWVWGLRVGATTAVCTSLAVYLVGCTLKIYEITNIATDLNESVTHEFSIFSIGMDLPSAVFEEEGLAGARFLQFTWFLIAVAMPLYGNVAFGILYWIPLSKRSMERLFFGCEIAFSWSCAEVVLVTSLFVVLQLPTFGQNLIEEDCDFCFEIQSEILYPGFSWLVAGVACNIATNLVLYGIGKQALFVTKRRSMMMQQNNDESVGTQEKEEEEGEASSMPSTPQMNSSGEEDDDEELESAF